MRDALTVGQFLDHFHGEEAKLLRWRRYKPTGCTLEQLLQNWVVNVEWLLTTLEQGSSSATGDLLSDYEALLHLRGQLQHVVDRLPPRLRAVVLDWLEAEVDARFVGATEVDHARLLRNRNVVTDHYLDQGWWFQLIPRRGAVRERLDAGPGI